jgi:hypothetical protein
MKAILFDNDGVLVDTDCDREMTMSGDSWQISAEGQREQAWC